MGFRDELTSASDLDTTTTLGGAGVIIDGPRATFQDGKAGSGYIEATSSSESIVGSRFHGVGPDVGAVRPEWSMTAQGLPAGGYESVFTLTADLLRVSASGIDVVSTALTLPAPFAPGPAGAPVADRIGDRVELRGSLTSATYTAPAGTVFGLNSVFPVALAPAVSRYFTVAVVAAGGSYSTCFVNVQTDGGITCVPQAALGAGFQISLAGIRWRLGVT